MNKWKKYKLAEIFERFTSLKADFEAQLKEETELNKRILENLGKIEFKNE